MARSEHALNSERGIHYADGGTHAPVYYPDPKQIEAIQQEWEDYATWLRRGISNGWISEVVCDTHEGLPMTDEEMEEWDGGWDICIPAVRVWGCDRDN